MPIESKISVDDLVEVKLSQPDDFLKVKETLTRIGISSRRENKLYQSCHILHKRGKYYIVHFKELFSLEGLATELDEKEYPRRKHIPSSLEEWGLVEVVDTDKIEVLKLPLNQLKILSFREKPDWELCPKYHIGKK